jgi:acetate kinase
MKILVLNSGSSSLKYKLFLFPEQKVLATGLIERIGERQGRVTHKVQADSHEISYDKPISAHEEALSIVGEFILHGANLLEDLNELKAVGHRVVHGGEFFSSPTLITPKEIEILNGISYLAPLHNPSNLKGIEVSMKIFPKAKQIAVFDTAFHQTLPEYAYRYALPNELYEKHGLRAYGFHGTSHQFVSRTARRYLMKEGDDFNCISIHLGNGCSITAIRNGESVDHSMGLTPLGGLVMGSRPGDFDPSLILFMQKQLEMSIADIEVLLNKNSGLQGLSGENDMRELLQRYHNGDEKAILAISMYCYRIKKYIGAYAAAMGRLDAIIFTAGVGENSDFIREMVCTDMAFLGIELDPSLNKLESKKIRAIQAENNRVKILVIPTDEELEIALQAEHLLQGNQF